MLNQSPILSGFVPTDSETKLVHGYFAANSIMELQMKLRWPSTNSSWSLNGFVRDKSKSLSRHIRHLRFRQHVDIAARVTRRWPTGLINHIIFTSKSRVEGFIEYASKTCIPTKESTNRMSVAPVLERRRYIRKQFIRGHPGTPWNRRYSAKNIST